MSLENLRIDPEQQQAAEKAELQGYNFQPGNAEDFADLIEEIKEDKQNYPEFEPEPEPEQEEPQDAPSEASSARVDKFATATAAKFITNNADRLIAFLGDLIIGDDDFDASATAEEKKEIQECLEKAFPQTSKGIPPWLIATVTILLIYAPKFVDGFQTKKLKQQLAKSEAQRLALLAENEKLRQMPINTNEDED